LIQSILISTQHLSVYCGSDVLIRVAMELIRREQQGQNIQPIIPWVQQWGHEKNIQSNYRKTWW